MSSVTNVGFSCRHCGNAVEVSLSVPSAPSHGTRYTEPVCQCGRFMRLTTLPADVINEQGWLRVDYQSALGVPAERWATGARRAGKTDAARREFEWQVRLLSAMAAMSNVMRGLDDTAIRMRWEDIAYEYLGDDRNRNESSPVWQKAMRFMADGGRDRASARWSRRVRAGVAALPKAGPVVCCQGDYDDE